MTKRNRGLARRTLLRRAVRFAFLTCVFSLVIVLMAFAEALVLWLGGNDFASKALLNKISIGDFSISANGEWGVSRVSFTRKSRRGGVVHDVIVHNLRGQSAVPLHVSRYRPRCVAVSPTSDVVAIGCWDGSIRTWSGPFDREAGLSASDVRLRLHDRVPDHPACLAFSPDGRLLAASGMRFTHVWRWPSGELLQKRSHDGDLQGFLSFSGESRRILSPGAIGEACLWEAHTGQTIRVISHGDGYVVDAAVSPDARLAAFADSIGRLRVYSLVSGEELWCQSTWGRSVAFSPDGRFLATDCPAAGGGGRVNLYDATSGQRMCELAGHDALCPRLAFAPDGLLYSYDQLGVIRAWNVECQREQWYFSTLAWASDNQFFHEASEQDDPCRDHNDRL
ncbi:MAG: hypothetical protein H8E44_07840 [Planctomycetes bacterium]|nr:hypothetical protein [Planctomycetota bacterium]MBL7041246.1 hypothetical protein [Pirellulaceae bacterium]